MGSNYVDPDQVLEGRDIELCISHFFVSSCERFSLTTNCSENGKLNQVFLTNFPILQYSQNLELISGYLGGMTSLFHTKAAAPCAIFCLSSFFHIIFRVKQVTSAV